MTGPELNMSVKEREKTVVFFLITGCYFFHAGKLGEGLVNLLVLYNLSHESEKKQKSITHLILILNPVQEDKFVYEYSFTYEHVHENPN